MAERFENYSMNSLEHSKHGENSSKINIDISRDKVSPKLDPFGASHPRRTRRSYSMVSSLDKLTNKLSLMDFDKKKLN